MMWIIWGLGIGDWGLGIGDWGLGIGPNPQSPNPNPQSPIPKLLEIKYYVSKLPIINNLYDLFKLKLFFKRDL